MRAPSSPPRSRLSPTPRRLRATLLGALTTSAILLTIAVLAGAVRVLPLIFDPRVPLRLALPFARSLLGVAAEASLLVGWPIGWGLAAARRVESGEARVLALLGEPPWRTTLRLAPEALLLGAVLFSVSLAGGRDAEAPGHVVDSLLEEGRVSCLRANPASGPQSFAVPLADATWLCDPPRPPRLVAFAPASLSPALAHRELAFTAARARVSGDLRVLDLDDVHLAFAHAPDEANRAASSGSPSLLTEPGSPAGPGPSFVLRARHVRLAGLPSWARASSVPALLRGLIMAASAVAAAFATVERLLRSRRTNVPMALALSAAGPLAALLTLRLLDVRSLPAVAFALVPLAAGAAPFAVAAAARVFPLLRHRLARLRSQSAAATT